MSRAAGLASLFLWSALLPVAQPALAQTRRVRVTAGFGVAAMLGDLADVTGVGGFATAGIGFPRGDRFTFWLEGSASGIPGSTNPEITGNEWQYSTRYLATGEYRFTRPWSPWHVSGTLGVGATTFWDNDWPTYFTDADGRVNFDRGVEIVALDGTHFVAVPGFRIAHAFDPNLSVELIGRAGLSFYEGEAFRFDTVGTRIDLEPPGSPIVTWGFTLGTRLRAGGAPEELAELEPGDQVRLWTSDGRQLEGRWIGVADRRLRLETRGDSARLTQIDLGDVQNAAVLHSSADRGGLIGAAAVGAVGALLGGIAGQVGCEVDCSGAWAGPAVALGLAGAAMGFVAGSLLGGLEGDWTSVSF